MRFGPPRRKAFTLVELLVVIGIIALLISILLPALSKARQQGNWAVCLSNLKQIGNALTMYANENKGYLPRPASGANGPWPDDFVNWQPGPGAVGWSSPNGNPSFKFNDTALALHLNAQDDKLARVFRCPGDIPNDRPPQPGRAAYGEYPYSYSMYPQEAANLPSAWDPFN